MDEAAGLLSAADGLLTTCDVRKGAEIYIVCFFCGLLLNSVRTSSGSLTVLLLQATAPVFRSRRGLVSTSSHIKPKRRLFWVPTCTLVDKSGFFYTAKVSLTCNRARKAVLLRRSSSVSFHFIFQSKNQSGSHFMLQMPSFYRVPLPMSSPPPSSVRFDWLPLTGEISRSHPPAWPPPRLPPPPRSRRSLASWLWVRPCWCYAGGRGWAFSRGRVLSQGARAGLRRC